MERTGPILVVLAAFLSFLPPPAPSAAQLRGRTAPVLAPGVPLSAPDDGQAVDVNPSALGLLDAWSLVYVHADPDDGQGIARSGDALRLGLPLPLGIGVGASVQSVRPSDGGSSYGIGTLALALAPSPSLGVGGAVRWYGSGDDSIHGLTAVDLGVSWRPAPSLALSVLGRDLNGLVGLAGVDLPASFVLGAGLRPTGSRVFTLDLAGAVDTDGRVGARGTIDLALPQVGRILLMGEVDGLEGHDPQWLASAGLEAFWGGVGAGGGAYVGDGLGGTPGWYVTARLEGAQRSGLPLGRYVADVEVRGSLGARGILSLVQKLDRALHDRRANGVLLRFRSSGMGTAYAQEVRVMIEALEAAGKPVVCHLDAGSGAELYACAAASRTLLDPAGGVRLAGLHVETLYLAELMRTLRIRAEFVRIGRYKSAPEQLTNERPSEPAREQRRVLYDDVYARLIADLARDYGISRARATALVDGGPYVSHEAVEAGLVAGTADELDLERSLEEAWGQVFPRLTAPPAQVSASWGRPAVGVVVVDGDIVDGENDNIPIIGIYTSGGKTVSEAIDRLANDPSVAVIVLRVDSPGGSALASDQIWRAVMRARRRKPVIASMGAMAASGGYYVASAADEIWADPSTVTGSIGIFFGKVDFAQLAEEIGVGIELYGRGRHAGLESMYRPFTPAERLLVAQKIRIWYRLFLQRIATGRGMAIEDIHPVAQGRVWSGDAALGIGLVDRLGGFGSALARAREMAELDADARITIVPRRPVTVLDYVLGVGDDGARAAEGMASPRLDLPLRPELRQAATFAVGLAGVSEGIPVARLPMLVSIE